MQEIMESCSCIPIHTVEMTKHLGHSQDWLVSQLSDLHQGHYLHLAKLDRC